MRHACDGAVKSKPHPTKGMGLPTGLSQLSINYIVRHVIKIGDIVGRDAVFIPPILHIQSQTDSVRQVNIELMPIMVR